MKIENRELKINGEHRKDLPIYITIAFCLLPFACCLSHPPRFAIRDTTNITNMMSKINSVTMITNAAMVFKAVRRQLKPLIYLSGIKVRKIADEESFERQKKSNTML